MQDLYQLVTDRIVAALEAGAPPWVRPWNVATDPVPMNAETRRLYRGVNFLTLAIEAHTQGYTRNCCAAFFVRSNNRFYVSKGHAVGLLLADAEKLRTEWVTNRSVTETEARQVDRTQVTGSTFGRLIEERRNGTQG